MSLADLIRGNGFEHIATATFATDATHRAPEPENPGPEGPTVATVATVAVASPPDVETDTRRTCNDCTELVRGHCRAAARGELAHAARRYEPIPDRLHRCLSYRPGPGDTDRRPGPERYPGMARKAASTTTGDPRP